MLMKFSCISFSTKWHRYYCIVQNSQGRKPDLCQYVPAGNQYFHSTKILSMPFHSLCSNLSVINKNRLELWLKKNYNAFICTLSHKMIMFLKIEVPEMFSLFFSDCVSTRWPSEVRWTTAIGWLHILEMKDSLLKSSHILRVFYA